MIPKLFEIRDRGTFIPALAVQLHPEVERERLLLWRSGFGQFSEQQGTYVMLSRLEGGGKAEHDPYDWPNRTMQVAHQYIAENFDQLASGSLVDVEFILGEAATPKQSELDRAEIA